VYARERLPRGARLQGPAIVEEMGALTVLPQGWRLQVGRLGELMLEKEAK
jgi:N-methylhydantoinase A/oxoprolinase/acetone carboxylase beta subunit